MCVGQSPRAHPLGSAREKRCGRALRWHKQQLICPMPNTPEVSGWQSLGQASEQCWPWAGSEVRSAGVRERQSMAGQGLCSSLAVEQHEWALSKHVLLPLDSAA